MLHLSDCFEVSPDGAVLEAVALGPGCAALPWSLSDDRRRTLCQYTPKAAASPPNIATKPPTMPATRETVELLESERASGFSVNKKLLELSLALTLRDYKMLSSIHTFCG